MFQCIPMHHRIVLVSFSSSIHLIFFWCFSLLFSHPSELPFTNLSWSLNYLGFFSSSSQQNIRIQIWYLRLYFSCIKKKSKNPVRYRSHTHIEIEMLTLIATAMNLSQPISHRFIIIQCNMWKIFNNPNYLTYAMRQAQLSHPMLYILVTSLVWCNQMFDVIQFPKSTHISLTWYSDSDRIAQLIAKNVEYRREQELRMLLFHSSISFFL